MNTFNLNIEECTQKKDFPLELLFNGNRIYKNLKAIARTTVGIIILTPALLAGIVFLPLTYLLIAVVFTYYSIKFKKFTSSLHNIKVNKENYEGLYNLYYSTNNSLKEFDRIMKKSKQNGSFKSLLVKPLTYYMKQFRKESIKIKTYLEPQLFEAYDPEKISIDDVQCFQEQLQNIDHDWDDDELWRDFQVKHSHCPNN